MSLSKGVSGLHCHKNGCRPAAMCPPTARTKNSPTVFQRVEKTLLAGRKGRDVWAFMDDIRMGTQTSEEHPRSLRSVLDTFLVAVARLRLSKCTFGTREVEVLRHRIRKQGLKPSDLHLQGIRNLRQRENGEDLMRFLWLTNCFAEFLEHFAHIASPLYAVLRDTGLTSENALEKSRHTGLELAVGRCASESSDTA